MTLAAAGAAPAGAALPSRPGCTDTALPANDDGSTGAIDPGFKPRFGNTTFPSLYVNNNGNLTFGSAFGTFTPFDFTTTDQTLAIVAPFLADVDTRGSDGGTVTYGRSTYDGRTAFCARWDRVGYFNQKTDKRNSFQALVVDRSGAGDIGGLDLVFEYDAVAWETGDASGGTAGRGGSSAAVGYSTGEGIPALQYLAPGSLVSGSFVTGGPKDLAAGSNVGQAGRYVFHVAGTSALQGPDVTTQPNTAQGTRDMNVTDFSAPLSETTQQSGGTIAAAPLRGSPLRGSPLRGSPLRGSPLRGSPLRGSPLRGSPLRGSLLTDVPLRGSQLWTDVLAGTRLADQPLQTITLGQVFELFNDGPVGSLTLDDLDVARSTALRNVSVGSLLLLGRPRGELPTPPGGWPAVSTNPADTLIDIELRGGDLSSFWRTPLPLNAAVLGPTTDPAPLAQVPLDAIDFGATSIAGTPVARIADLCATTCGGQSIAEYQASRGANAAFPTYSVRDLLTALSRSGGALTLQDLLPGIVAIDRLPVGDLDLETLESRLPGTPSKSVTATVSGEISCNAAVPDLLSVDVAAPGAAVVPGTARVKLDDGTSKELRVPSSADGVRRFDRLQDGSPLGSLCGTLTDVHRLTLTVALQPPARLGEFPIQTLIRTAGNVRSGQSTVTVRDEPDPGASGAGAMGVQPDRLYAQYVSSETDVDAFRLDLPAGTAPNSTVTVSLSNLASDVDLYVQGPPVGIRVPASRQTAAAGAPLNPLPDTNHDPDGTDAAQPAVGLQVGPLDAESLRALPLRGQSTRPGTAAESVSFVVRDGDDLTKFRATVAGAASRSAYRLRLTVTPAPAAPPCISRPRTVHAVPADAHPAERWPTTMPRSGAPQTLILWNPIRMASDSSAERVHEVAAELARLAGDESVNGVVAPVEGHPTLGGAVADAYDAWDANPCDPGAANDVVAAVSSVVDGLRSQLPDLRHVVLVGPDSQLPQARVPDDAGVANERDAADELTVTGANGQRETPISAAMRASTVLTDDPYGDFDPRAWLNGTLSVPDVGLGRLVERPGDIIAQVDQYMKSHGVLDPTTKSVAGYDFLTDAAQQISDDLAPLFSGGGGGPVTGEWTAADARGMLNGAAPGITSINAHYDHYRALPAAAFNGSSADLLNAADVNVAPGGLLFSIGCHAGLNAVDVYSPTAGAPELGDWAQRLTAPGDVFTGNTGFGYGDSVALAYGERLMSNYAQQLATRRATAGQALAFAKQRYLASSVVASVYDAKVLQAATFYGLPMYRLGTSGAVGPNALPASDTTGGGIERSGFDVHSEFTRHATARGTYYTARAKAPDADAGADDEPPIAAPYRPLVPGRTRDVTDSSRPPLHGALITTLESHDVTPFDPVWARPTIDSSAREPEISARTAVFPDVLQRVDRYVDDRGRHETLSLAAGQFLSGNGGTQRLFDRIGGDLLRSNSSDYDPPQIDEVTGTNENGALTFTVHTTDSGTSGYGGLVLYQDGTGAWRSATLTAGSGGTFTARASLSGGQAVFYAQLVDQAGNVTAATNKGRGFLTVTPREITDPTLTPSRPADVPAAIYTSAVTLTVDGGGQELSQFSYRVGGRPPQPLPASGQIPLTTDGSQLVTVTAPDGRQASRLVVVDLDAPRVTGTPTGLAGIDGWFRGPVLVTWSCTDSASGVATCPDPVTVTQEGSNLTAQAEGAVDNAGRRASGQLTGINIDLTKPTISGAATTLPNGNGWYRGDVTVRWTCTDSGGSGIRPSGGCPADATVTGSGAQVAGPQGTARDRAGNEENATSGPFAIDREAPITTATASPDGSAVSLDAVDPLSGKDTIKYALDGGAETVYTGPISLEAGRHQLRFYATDFAGNVEAAKTLALVSTPKGPKIVSDYKPGWRRGPLTIKFTCTPRNGSPVRTCPAPVTLSTEGRNQSVTSGMAVDAQGNTSVLKITGIDIDNTAPAVQGAPTSPPDRAGWYRRAVTVRWTCTDALSGVTGSNCPAPTSVTTSGSSVTAGPVTAKDRAGNTGTGTVTGLKIDRVAPSIGFVSPADGATVSAATVPVTVSATDAHSGVWFVWIQGTFAKSTASGYTSTVALRCGANTIAAIAFDNAGNYAMPILRRINRSC